MRFWKHFWKRKKCPKMSQIWGYFWNFSKKVYGLNLFFPFCNLEHYGFISIFHFFYFLFQESGSGFHFWTFLKCPFLRISEKSWNKVIFYDWKYFRILLGKAMSEKGNKYLNKSFVNKNQIRWQTIYTFYQLFYGINC